MNDKTIRVLSIEDNPGDATLIQELLTEATRLGWNLPHFDVEHVSSAGAGLARLEEGGIDVVLSDLDLPDSQAEETFAQIHANGPDVPIVVLTGRDDEELARQTVRVGAEDYLFKREMSGSLLAHSLIYAIERQQAKRALHRAHSQLERRVVERTRELKKANQRLEAEIAERQQAEQALRESEEKYRLLAETARDMICVHDLEGNIKYLNPAGLAFIGRSKEEALSMNVRDFIPSEDLPVLEERAHERRVGNEQRYLYEAEIVNLQGQSVPMEISSSPLVREGEVTDILLVARDITERKRTEAALHESEEQYRRLVEGSPDILYIYSDKRGALYWSQRVQDILGYDPDDLTENPYAWHDAIHPDDVPAVDEAIAEGNREAGFEIEYRVQDVDGNWRWFHDRFISKRRIGDEWIIEGLATDITERKRTEERLRESKKHLELVLRGGDLGTWDWDLRTDEVQYNEQWAEMKGYRLDEIEPHLRTWESLVHPDDLPGVYEKLNAHLEGQTPFYEAEFRMRHKSGEWLWVLDRGQVIEWDEEGNPVRACGTHLDITDRKRREDVIQARLRLAAASTTKSSEELMQLTLDEIEALTGSEIGFYHFLLEDQETLALQTWSTNTRQNMCQAEGHGRHYAVSEAGVWVDCVHKRRPVIHNDYQSLPHRKGLPPEHAPVTRELVLPIIRDERIVAVLGVGNKPTDYDSADVEIASELGDFSWEIVTRRHAEEALQRRATQLAILNDVGEQLVATLELGRVLDQAACLVQENFDYRHVGIFIRDREQDDFVMRAKAGDFADRFPPDHRLELGQGMVGWVGRHGERLLTNDVESEPRYVNLYPDMVPTRAELSVPIWVEEEIVGVLDIQSTERGAFDENDVVMIETLADQLGAAVKNAWLYEEAQAEIAERKRAEEALRESEGRYRILLESIRDSVYVLDREWRHTLVNDAAERFTGIPKDRLLGAKLTELFPGIEDTPFFTVFQRVMETREPDVVAAEYVFEDGRKRWYETNVYPVPEGILCVSRDVTERKRAESALHTRLRYEKNLALLSKTLLTESFPKNDVTKPLTYLREAASAARVYVFRNFTDDEGRLCMRQTCESCAPGVESQIDNPALQHLPYAEGFERWADTLSRGEMIRGRVNAFPAEEQPILTAQDIRSILALPIKTKHKWHGFIGFDETRFDREWKDEDVRLLRTAAEMIGSYIERKQAEEALERYAAELERSNRDLEQFGYAVSHDLREPLRMVTSYLQLLERRCGDKLDAKAGEYIGYAVDGAQRLREMIKALLNLSRVGTRGQEFAPTDVKAIVERTLIALGQMIEESNAQITCDPLPTVMADEAQLAQVFQNLIANGIKFQHEGATPCVHISAKRDGDEWVFSVADNGIGIDPEQTGRVFQVFQRLHTREEYAGMGMGLALCRRIVERHGGRIWLESDPGEGSTFFFTLSEATPIMESRPTTTQAQERPASPIGE